MKTNDSTANKVAMSCPQCHAPFSIFSFQIYNPYKFHCPSCGCALTTANMNKQLILAGCIGPPISGFAICMEHFKIWQERQSYVFFAIALPVFIGLYFLLSRKGKLFKLSCDEQLIARQSQARPWLFLSGLIIYAAFLGGLNWYAGNHPHIMYSHRSAIRQVIGLVGITALFVIFWPWFCLRSKKQTA